jgi:ABC-type Na+ efflux pump permease subunit
MAMFFGAMLTAISTVYDREFGTLPLMLASPAGILALLAGRTIAATAIGVLKAASCDLHATLRAGNSRAPSALRSVAMLNPVTYAVDLTRAALGHGRE